MLLLLTTTVFITNSKCNNIAYIEHWTSNILCTFLKTRATLWYLNILTKFCFWKSSEQLTQRPTADNQHPSIAPSYHVAGGFSYSCLLFLFLSKLLILCCKIIELSQRTWNVYVISWLRFLIDKNIVVFQQLLLLIGRSHIRLWICNFYAFYTASSFTFRRNNCNNNSCCFCLVYEASTFGYWLGCQRSKQNW